MVIFNIKIYDGGDELWQWDTGRKLIIEGLSEGEQLHFHRIFQGAPYSLICYKKKDKVVCDIPDEILQIGEPFKIYAYISDFDGSKTIFSQEMSVSKRPKPPEYIYTPTEFHTVEEAVAKAVNEAIASGDFNGKDGYTPQRGIDYWTQADKEEIVSQTIEALPDASEVEY